MRFGLAVRERARSESNDLEEKTKLTSVCVN